MVRVNSDYCLHGFSNNSGRFPRSNLVRQGSADFLEAVCAYFACHGLDSLALLVAYGSGV